MPYLISTGDDDFLPVMSPTQKAEKRLWVLLTTVNNYCCDKNPQTEELTYYKNSLLYYYYTLNYYYNKFNHQLPCHSFTHIQNPSSISLFLVPSPQLSIIAFPLGLINEAILIFSSQLSSQSIRYGHIIRFPTLFSPSPPCN